MMNDDLNGEIIVYIDDTSLDRIISQKPVNKSYDSDPYKTKNICGKQIAYKWGDLKHNSVLVAGMFDLESKHPDEYGNDMVYVNKESLTDKDRACITKYFEASGVNSKDVIIASWA